MSESHGFSSHEITVGITCEFMNFIASVPIGDKHCIPLGKRVGSECKFKSLFIVHSLLREVCECS